MTNQQKADITLSTWQQFRDLTPAERMAQIDRYDAQLRAVASAMMSDPSECEGPVCSTLPEPKISAPFWGTLILNFTAWAGIVIVGFEILRP